MPKLLISIETDSECCAFELTETDMAYPLLVNLAQREDVPERFRTLATQMVPWLFRGKTTHAPRPFVPKDSGFA